jgi:hypothetical protein
MHLDLGHSHGLMFEELKDVHLCMMDREGRPVALIQSTARYAALEKLTSKGQNESAAAGSRMNDTDEGIRTLADEVKEAAEQGDLARAREGYRKLMERCARKNVPPRCAEWMACALLEKGNDNHEGLMALVDHIEQTKHDDNPSGSLAEATDLAARALMEMGHQREARRMVELMYHWVMWHAEWRWAARSLMWLSLLACNRSDTNTAVGMLRRSREIMENAEKQSGKWGYAEEQRIAAKAAALEHKYYHSQIAVVEDYSSRANTTRQIVRDVIAARAGWSTPNSGPAGSRGGH